MQGGSLDSSARVVDVALRSERLSSAFEVVPQALGVMYCCKVLESLKNAETDGTRENMARAVAQLAESSKGCVGIVEAGGCRVMVQALKVANTDDIRGNIAMVIRRLLEKIPGIPNAALSTERLSAAFEIVTEAERVVFIHAVLKSLKTAVDADGTVYHMTRVIAQLSENDIGCLAVLEAGGCGAMVQALIVAKTDDVIGSIALAIKYLGVRTFTHQRNC